MTTTEQYARLIRDAMARHRTSTTAAIVLSMIEAAMACDEGIDAVKRILAADAQLTQEFLDGLSATVVEVRAAQQEESTR